MGERSRSGLEAAICSPEPRYENARTNKKENRESSFKVKPQWSVSNKIGEVKGTTTHHLKESGRPYLAELAKDAVPQPKGSVRLIFTEPSPITAASASGK